LEQSKVQNKITNKRLYETISLVNVTYELLSEADSNVTLEFYLNNNLINTKHIISQKHKQFMIIILM
jgi:hypothetical protein